MKATQITFAANSKRSMHISCLLWFQTHVQCGASKCTHLLPMLLWTGRPLNALDGDTSWCAREWTSFLCFFSVIRSEHYCTSLSKLVISRNIWCLPPQTFFRVRNLWQNKAHLSFSSHLLLTRSVPAFTDWHLSCFIFPPIGLYWIRVISFLANLNR